MVRLNLDRIRAAIGKIDPIFLNTPQYECESLGRELGCRVTIKVETLNPIRCFKGRGVELAVSHVQNEGFRSVVCASAGNLGQALAYSCRKRGMAAIVTAAQAANRVKVQRMTELGADVRPVAGDIEDAKETAREISKDENAFLLEDSETLDTCEGAGTIGLELAESSQSFDVVFAALGAGALATGVGFPIKSLSPDTQVVCVQPAGAPAMTLSWRAKRVITTDSFDTIADGVAGRLPLPIVLDDLLQIADDAVLVSEQNITTGMRLLYEHTGLVTEPSAALGIAALLEDPARYRDQHIATVICGSNVALDDFARWTS